MNKKWVVITSFLIILAVVGWDVWLYTDDIPRNAISQVIIDASDGSRTVAAAIGFAIGALWAHWFW